MRFYTSVGPNPRVVKMYLAEKGIDLPRVEVDLRGGVLDLDGDEPGRRGEAHDASSKKGTG